MNYCPLEQREQVLGYIFFTIWRRYPGSDQIRF